MLKPFFNRHTFPKFRFHKKSGKNYAYADGADGGKSAAASRRQLFMPLFPPPSKPLTGHYGIIFLYPDFLYAHRYKFATLHVAAIKTTTTAANVILYP